MNMISLVNSDYYHTSIEISMAVWAEMVTQNVKQ